MNQSDNTRPGSAKALPVPLALGVVALACLLRPNAAEPDPKSAVGQSAPAPAAATSAPSVTPSRANQPLPRPPSLTLRQKLDLIVLEEWSVPSETPLVEVLKGLQAKTRKRDPDRVGVNFLAMGTGANGGPGIETFTLKIDPPLRKVRLREVLQAVAQLAKPPAGQAGPIALRFSVTDYAVVFQATDAAAPAQTRTLRANPNTFRQGLERIGPVRP